MITALILSALLAKDILTAAKPLKTTEPFRKTLFKPRNSNVNDPGHLPNLQLSSPVPTANGTIFLQPILFPRINVAKRANSFGDDKRCETARTKFGVTANQPILEAYSHCPSDYKLAVVCSYITASGELDEGEVDLDCPMINGLCVQQGDMPYSEADCIAEDQVAKVEAEISDVESVGSSESVISTLRIRSTAGSLQNVTALVRSWMADTGEPVGVGTTTYYTSTADHTETQVVNSTGVYYSQSQPAIIGPGDGFDILIEPPKAYPVAFATVATIIFEICLLIVP